MLTSSRYIKTFYWQPAHSFAMWILFDNYLSNTSPPLSHLIMTIQQRWLTWGYHQLCHIIGFQLRSMRICNKNHPWDRLNCLWDHLHFGRCSAGGRRELQPRLVSRIDSLARRLDLRKIEQTLPRSYANPQPHLIVIIYLGRWWALLCSDRQSP